MLYPAILKAELQGAHVTGLDQPVGFHAQIRNDPFHDPSRFPHPDSAGRAEGQGIGAEGGAGEPQPQSGWTGELAEHLAPAHGFGVLRIETEVVHFIGDGQPGLPSQAPR
jgi:hypothetical protein